MALSEQQVEDARPCKFGRIYDTYSDADKAILTQWVEDRWPSARIAEAMTADNSANRITYKSLLVHLRAQCACASGSPLKGVWRAAR